MGAEYIYQCCPSVVGSLRKGGCGREVCDRCFDHSNTETCPYCGNRWTARCVTSCSEYDWVRG